MKLIRAREGNVMIDVVGALRRASGVMKLISSDYPDLDLCVGLCIVLLTFVSQHDFRVAGDASRPSANQPDPRHAGKRTNWS